MKFSINVILVFVNEKDNFGNPVGIIINEKQKLNKKQRQEIAAKLNYSETVFVNNLEKPSVSIFNPKSEVAFAGHAVLGTAYFLRNQLGKKVTSIRCGKTDVAVSGKGKLTWITAPLSIMPPWNFKQLDSAEAVEKLTKEQFSDQKHLVVWAWIDKSKNLIRARTFAPDWGIPEDEANGSGSMLLATKLKRDLKIIHGKGSVIYTQSHGKKSAKVGGLVKLDRIMSL